MLFVFHGNDTYKIADQANKLVAGLRAKRPDAEVYTFEVGSFTVSALDELIEAQGLFVQKHVVVLNGLCDIVETRELVSERAERFADSENIFVIREGALLAPQKKVFEKHAHKIEEHRISKQARVFDEYGMVRALKARSRRSLWEGYMRASHAGDKPEAICGLLHWGVKDMLVHAARYTNTYSVTELRTMSRELVSCYHDAHRGLVPLPVALERWVLTI